MPIDSSGQTSTTIPEKPISSPSSVRPRRRSPLPATASTPAIQNGAVATSTAASPLGTHCSA